MNYKIVKVEMLETNQRLERIYYVDDKKATLAKVKLCRIINRKLYIY